MDARSHRRSAHPPRARVVDAAVLRRLCRAREFIHAAAFDASPTLDDIAAQAGMSPFHFLRTFRDVFGETPRAYLTTVRLARARELLVRPDATVTGVCMDVGFASVGSFSALFARRIGRSPSAFQRETRRLIVAVPAGPASLYIPGCFLARFAPHLL